MEHLLLDINKKNPFAEPPIRKMEYCSVCDAEHLQYDDGDIFDCMIYYRNNVESVEKKKEREDKIEIWDIKNKVWVKKSDFYNAV